MGRARFSSPVNLPSLCRSGEKTGDSVKDSELQREIEQLTGCHAKAVADAKALQATGAAHLTTAGRGLIAENLPAVREGIIARLRAEIRKGRGRRSFTYAALSDCDADAVAFLVIKTTLNAVLQGDRHHEYATLQRVALAIGAAVEVEARLTSFAKAEPQTVRSLQQFHKGGEPWRLKLAMVQAMQTKGMTWASWSDADKFKVGQVCLDILLAETALVELVELNPAKAKRKGMTGVRPADSTVCNIGRLNDIFEPKHSPMLCEPKNWSGPWEGGYLLPNRASGTAMLRNYHPDQLSVLNPDIMPRVFEALNAVQAVPWRVNRRLLKTMRALWDKPQCRVDLFAGDGKELNVPQVELALSEADRCAAEGRVWLPAALDFRGRLYYLPYLNPQGPDMMRALFDFADGEPLDDERWLLAYGRTLYAGRAEYAERVAWYNENADNILRAAAEPLVDTWWREAKEPWQFLRWCFEIEGFVEESKKPYNFAGYYSAMAIYVDGSCNGMQHLGALLRSESAGAAVNLSKGWVPRDIYSDVAEALQVKLEAAAAREELAGLWYRLGVGRNAVKPIVMCVPYGMTSWSSREGLFRRYGEQLPTDKRSDAIAYLDRLVWKTIGEVTGASKVLSWLGEVAGRYNKAGRHVEWITPSGFAVRHRYFESASRKVKTQLGDGISEKRIGKKTNRLHKTESKRGLAPNFIHSLDAAVLVETVCRCRAAGKRHVCVIHDSFGTPAGDIEFVQRAATEAFAAVHGEDLLGKYHRAFESGLGEKLPKPPARGQLDIKAVAKALYAFS